MSQYGIFADLAGTALALSAAATAIGLAWNKRANWAPPEEAVPAGVARMASLGAMIGLAAIFALGKRLGVERLLAMAAACFVVGLIGLAVSAYLSVTRTFTYADGKRTLGGFRMTSEAAKIAKRKQQTEQQLFYDAQGDHDLVWTRGSRAAAHVAITLGYIALILCGTIALTAAAASAFMGAFSGGLVQ